MCDPFPFLPFINMTREEGSVLFFGLCWCLTGPSFYTVAQLQAEQFLQVEPPDLPITPAGHSFTVCLV